MLSHLKNAEGVIPLLLTASAIVIYCAFLSRINCDKCILLHLLAIKLFEMSRSLHDFH